MFRDVSPVASIARVVPFACFIALLALDQPIGSVLATSGVEARWSYVFRIIAAAISLSLFWRQYSELFSTGPLQLRAGIGAMLVGLAVFALWIVPYPEWALQGGAGLPVPPVDRNGELDLAWIIIRMVGAVLVVPVIEELFWRSYLMRRMDYDPFTELKPSAVKFRSVLIASLLFATAHHQWLAAIGAGMAYGLAYRRYENLWIPVIAHVTTNAALGVWVITRGHWSYW